MNANIEITTDSNGCATKLLLNGTDISNMVSAVTFRQVGGAMPAVELTFVADCVSIKTPACVRYPQELLDAVMKKGREDLRSANLPCGLTSDGIRSLPEQRTGNHTVQITV